MKSDQKLKELLLLKKKSLLEDSVRCNPDSISQILSDVFTENTTSGKIYTYRKGDAFGKLKDKIVILENTFDIIYSSNEICVLKYRTKKICENEQIVNRSSTWIKQKNEWKLLFHQGTESHEK